MFTTHTDRHTSNTLRAIRWKCTKRTRTCAHKGTRARTPAHEHARMRLQTGARALHTRSHFTNRRRNTQSHARARAQTCRETCMRCVSLQQHRQIHLHILRCSESHGDEIRNDCGACVLAGQRVGVCESVSTRALACRPSLCACGDIGLSFPRERAAASARTHVDPVSSPEYTPLTACVPKSTPTSTSRVPVESF